MEEGYRLCMKTSAICKAKCYRLSYMGILFQAVLLDMQLYAVRENVSEVLKYLPAVPKHRLLVQSSGD